MESEKNAVIALIKIVKDLGLEGSQCSFVRSPKDYTLHRVEAPTVETEEMRAAVRWKIKDLLDTKIEETAIDVFELPQDAYRGRKMVYVVASQKSSIQQILVNLVNSAHLANPVCSEFSEFRKLTKFNKRSRFNGFSCSSESSMFSKFGECSKPAGSCGNPVDFVN